VTVATVPASAPAFATSGDGARHVITSARLPIHRTNRRRAPPSDHGPNVPITDRSTSGRDRRRLSVGPACGGAYRRSDEDSQYSRHPCPPSARAASARCTKPVIRGSTAPSRSRSCPPLISNSEPASSAKRRPSPPFSTRTSVKKTVRNTPLVDYAAFGVIVTLNPSCCNFRASCLALC